MRRRIFAAAHGRERKAFGAMPLAGIQLAFHAAVLVALLAGIACGADSGVTTPPSPTSRPGSPAIGECERASAPPEKVAIVPHGERLEAVIEPIKDALIKAIDHAAAAYGWTSAEPVCVHVFPGDAGFVSGLERFGGFDKATAKSYQTFFGTIGRDIASGRDAIYLNAAFPDRMPFLVTHEFFHIVQLHVAGTAGGPQTEFPTWFLEGVADWEAMKLQEPPFPNWLTLLRSEQRAGRTPALSSLVTWDQWQRALESGNPAVPTAGYNKARAAVIFLEEIAGPKAPREVLRGIPGGNLTQFESVFREVTGLSLPEFETRLDAHLTDSPGGE